MDIESLIKAQAEVYQASREIDLKLETRIAMETLISCAQRVIFAAEVLNEIKNHYPDTIFIEPTKQQYELFHSILQEHGLTLDKFSGAIGRKIYKHIIDECTAIVAKNYVRRDSLPTKDELMRIIMKTKMFDKAEKQTRWGDSIGADEVAQAIIERINK